MGLRTQNFEHGAVSDQLLGGASNASGFGDYPTVPFTHLPPSSKRTHFYELFNAPFTSTASHVAAGGGGLPVAATGATGDVNFLHTRFNAFEFHILGAGQTLIVPKIVATGYDWSGDAADNEGFEITLGCETSAADAVKTNTSFRYTCGTSDAFFFRCKFSLADVSDSDDCAMGFRKNEIYQANIDDYDEMACLNVIAGDIKIETILNAGATTTTDTTNNWLDGETHTLQVNVSAARAVTYKIDGADPIATAAFSFDSGEVVIPFFFMLHVAASTVGLVFQEWEVGFQSASGD